MGLFGLVHRGVETLSNRQLYDKLAQRGVETLSTTGLYDLVQRGVEKLSPHEALVKRGEDKIDVAPWKGIVIVVTFVLALIFISAIDYSLRYVVAPLAMVETPSSAITVVASDEDVPLKDAKEDAAELGPTITLVQQKPITSSIRATLRHVVSHGGKFARWRGFKSSLLYTFCYLSVCSFFDKVIPHFIPLRLILTSGLTGAALALIHAAWTHKVISMPTTQSYWSRIPSRQAWKVLALPAAVEASSTCLSMYIGRFAAFLMQDSNPMVPHAATRTTEFSIRIGSGLFTLFIMFASFFFIVLPARVTLIRVEGSILPEDQDAIVPFDRSFDGKVMPRVLGGTGSIGFVDAWKSFGWEARKRVVKLFLKIWAIVLVLVVAVAHVVVLVAFLVAGKEIKGQLPGFDGN